MLRKAKTIPYISKIKAELKCSEVDLLEFLDRHKNDFCLRYDKGRAGVVITDEGEKRGMSQIKTKQIHSSIK
ncbi:MAG TPA: hypothetical protein VK186_26185 [Candidatus Deferrimicrobium sp.]|nr:hypothetical protein [Candidatus Kapabacteria bacterium]HLP62357.1 hypothetical protein [Candidatus Deferrimicrobium sp.]